MQASNAPLDLIRTRFRQDLAGLNEVAEPHLITPLQHQTTSSVRRTRACSAQSAHCFTNQVRVRGRIVMVLDPFVLQAKLDREVA
jgi:hypothetical protein